MSSSALAEHEAIITITPDLANCGALGNTFTVNVQNHGDSDDSILQVEIYKALLGLSDFDCGPAPAGWSYLPWPDEDRCIYVTGLSSSYKIVPGDNLNFTFDATMWSETCASKFVVVTVDDDDNQGDRDTNNVYVDIDCSDPVIIKEVGFPKLPGDGFDWWITQDTSIEIDVTEYEDCDLGLDYCEITYTVDGGDPVTQVLEEFEPGTHDWSYEWSFDEDSVHDIEVVCYDVAQNHAELVETDKVDDTPPTTEKDFIGPQHTEGLVEWIDSVTTVELTVEDGGEICAIGVDKTWYRNDWWEGGIESEGAAGCYDPDEYCNYEWYGMIDSPYEMEDYEGCIEEAQEECGDMFVHGTPEWFACMDEWLVVDCEITDWKLYDGTPVEKEDESCHVLSYFSVDHLGNVEDMNINCFFVDKTAPEVHKENGDAIFDCGEPAFEDNDECFHWITTEMPIEFRCDDSWNGEAPHPSGDEEICFMVSYDYVYNEIEEMYEWGYITEDYCSDIGGDYGKYGDDFCCVPATMEDPFDFYFMEESMHNLEYYCVDAVEKDSEVHKQYYKVDDTPPTITKTMIGTEHLGDCPPADEFDECYVRDHGENGVRVDVEDGGQICAVDEVVCTYELWWETDSETCIDEFDGTHLYNFDTEECFVEGGEFGEEGVDIIFTEDSTHNLIVNCEDELGNAMVEDYETFLVDSTPPVTEKIYGEPLVDTEGGYPKWITSDTPITLSAEDAKVGVDEIYKRVILLEGPAELACWDPETYCHPVDTAEVFTVYEGPFKINEDSCHMIEYYSVDLLGNTEDSKVQCIFVDNVPPEGIKEVGTPSFEGEGSTGGGESVTIRKEVTTGELATADPEIYLLADTTGSMGTAIADVKSNMVSLLGSIDAKFGAGDYKDFPYDSYAYMNRQVITDDDSLVTAAINAMSATGGSDGSEGQFYALQKIAEGAAGFSPDASKIVVWFGDAPAHDSVCSAISGEADITEASLITALNNAGIVVIAISIPGYYSTALDDNPMSSADDYDGYCTLGGTSGQATRIADATGGVHLTGVSYSEITDAIIAAIGTVTETTDVVPDASDCEFAGLDVSFAPLVHENVGGAETVVFDETIMLADGTSISTPIVCDIQFRSGTLGGIIATERVYVNTGESPTAPPEGSGSVDPEIVDIDLGEGGTIGPDWYVTKNTPIWLSCDDSWGETVPHPVDHETIFWRYSNWVDGFEGEPMYSEWFSQPYDDEPVEVNFPEDCWHDLEFYCVDLLGNDGVIDTEYFIVETVPPVIEKTMNGPYEGDCPPGEGDICFVDTATSVTVDAYDPQPHPVDEVECYYEYVVWEGDSLIFESDTMGPFAPPFDITFPEESKHDLTVWCHDALMNVEYDYETFYVDKTPPGIWKDYEDGMPLVYEFDEYWAKWINSEVMIYGGVTDDGPHKSGIDEVKYRTTVVDDEDCMYPFLFDFSVDSEEYNYDCEEVEGEGDWMMVGPEDFDEFEFNIPDESCHLIEIMATDNVGKCSLHKQWVYVDNTAPNPVKEVGEPKSPWDGLDANFYDLDEFCQTPGNCWKVTLLTPIELKCVDPEPHPVDHDTVCFKVELDGDDYTELYCDEGHYDGELVMRDDFEYCCLPQQLDKPFYFGEISEHNLAYYCVDALGNEGPIDDEKFKVEETAFEIQLNKKWNLVSVPVRLLDDSMNEVFKDVEDTVEAVWTWDPDEGWLVYFPDGDDGNDNLDTMLPGWGYWILSNEEDLLVIGGSLMSPAMMPPSKEIVTGWNLIGYYGAEGEEGYYGPAGNGEEAYCALYSLGESFLDKGWAYLGTYWEPDNPDLWKELDMEDNMDPGAGYWLLALEDGIYAPTSKCDSI